MSEQHVFNDTTLLVTVYNRSRSLRRLLSSFQYLNCCFEDIVVSDDGSRPEHLAAIRELQEQFPFRLITTPQNRGLGHNINKGQAAVKTPYTLYVQEDFVPKEVFPARLKEALHFMNERSDIDMVRFYSYFKYPHLSPVKDSLSEMKFKNSFSGYKKYYMYSDHPHLRRSNFAEKFGLYREGKNVDITEYSMMINFLQKKGKALYYEDHNSIFEQLNSADEPSTTRRNFWRESNHPVIRVIRDAYRYIKFRFDYAFRH